MINLKIDSHRCELLKFTRVHFAVPFSQIFCYSFPDYRCCYFLGYVPYAATIIHESRDECLERKIEKKKMAALCIKFQSMRDSDEGSIIYNLILYWKILFLRLKPVTFKLHGNNFIIALPFKNREKRKTKKESGEEGFIKCRLHAKKVIEDRKFGKWKCFFSELERKYLPLNYLPFLLLQLPFPVSVHPTFPPMNTVNTRSWLRSSTQSKYSHQNSL